MTRVVPRRVTFSRNLTLSLSRTCVSHCKYCAFATHRAHLHEPDEVERLLDGAVRRRVKELLVLTGDDPGHHPGVRARLTELGFDDFVAYVAWCCERALERGLLPHTNLGALSRADLGRLREVTASQGLMLESMRPDLVAHQGSPTKDPALRLETIRAAGELRIPFTSGILVGIGETEQDRIEALEALAAVHAEYGHLQEVILQNFVPHRRYYGEEPAEIAEEAQTTHAPGAAEPLPAWATEVTLDHMRTLVRESRRLMPDVGIQIPPNLSDWWLPLVDEGATDLGGLSANGDHISPEQPFPSVHEMRKRLAPRGAALAERLCVYPQYMNPDWLDQGVLDAIKVKYWSFIPRGASGRREERTIRRDLVPGAIERAHAGGALTEDELTALFAETRPEAIEDMRQAADSLRRELAGDTVTFVVNRNINVSNVCTVGCAFCGFGQGRRSPDAYEHDEDEFRRRVREAVDFGATEICMQSGIHPDWTIEDYEGWLRVAKDEAGRAGGYPPARLLADGAALHGRRAAARGGLRAPDGRRPRLHARHRRRGAPRRRAPAHLAEQAAGGALGGDHRGRPRRGRAHHGDGDVRPHRGALGAGRAHAGRARASGAHRRLHRVRAALVHPVPHDARAHARDRGDLARGQPEAHGGVPARARADHHEPPGELGEDGARRRHRGARLGHQRPRRDADGGVDQPPGRLLPRREARAGGPDRGGACGRPPGGGARHALRDPAPTTRCRVAA